MNNPNRNNRHKPKSLPALSSKNAILHYEDFITASCHHIVHFNKFQLKLTTLAKNKKPKNLKRSTNTYIIIRAIYLFFHERIIYIAACGNSSRKEFWSAKFSAF